MSIEQHAIVSIITPVYNRERLVRHTILSIKNQTYINWELILIDDGSTDNSVRIMMDYANEDSRIKLLRRTEGPKGAQICRNMGLNNAQGKYVIFLDSDDILADFCLAKRVHCFENKFPEMDFLVFPGLRFENELYDLNLLISSYRGDNVIPLFLNRDIPWITLNPIYKREALVCKSLNWDVNILIHQDILFHITCICRGLKFSHAGENPDCFWRQHDHGNIGNTNDFSHVIFISMCNLFNAIYDEMKKANKITLNNKLCLINFVFEHTIISSIKGVEIRSIIHYLNIINCISSARKILFIVFACISKFPYIGKITRYYYKIMHYNLLKRKYFLRTQFLKNHSL